MEAHVNEDRQSVVAAVGPKEVVGLLPQASSRMPDPLVRGMIAVCPPLQAPPQAPDHYNGLQPSRHTDGLLHVPSKVGVEQCMPELSTAT